ncbi:hypothetical protein ES288_A03G040800v1 [Gossypium darwinii]|uniref:Uncharacterized protein n=1 Tax=Gossypium darwinii TaxID=34276 RepID=A0A5D2H2J0_GOSDA|nr:hypothetical protein ES288_A03G040800v1 [Gossypium darwinii]
MPSQPKNPREESPSSPFDSVLDAWRMACGGGLARGDVQR